MTKSNREHISHNDADVFEKLANNLPLTEFELNLITDSDSIPNLVKIQKDNLEMNAELEEYFKEKNEKMINLYEEILRGITEYIEWEHNQEAQSAREHKIIELSYDAIDPIDISTEKDWAKELINTLLPLEHKYHGHIEEEIKRATPEELRVMKAVLQLASHSDKIRKFIFPENDTAHDMNMKARILFVGEVLKEIHKYEFMSNPKLIREIDKKIETKQKHEESEKPTSSSNLKKG